MEKSIKSAVITGVCGIIAGMVGGAWITNTFNTNYNTNNKIQRKCNKLPIKMHT